MRLEGKSIVVTGASAGMGQAIVRTVSMETEETIFSLLVGWQEVTP